MLRKYKTSFNEFFSISFLNTHTELHPLTAQSKRLYNKLSKCLNVNLENVNSLYIERSLLKTFQSFLDTIEDIPLLKKKNIIEKQLSNFEHMMSHYPWFIIFKTLDGKYKSVGFYTTTLTDIGNPHTYYTHALVAAGVKEILILHVLSSKGETEIYNSTFYHIRTVPTTTFFKIKKAS